MNVLNLIRNAPPEYPWERTPRQELVNRINLRWRAYCLLQATGIGFGAIATVVQPDYFASVRERRKSVKINASTIRDCLGMAAKG